MRHSTPVLEAFSQRLVQRRRDYGAVLETVAETVVDEIGDACVVSVVSPDGHLVHPVVVRHSDPEAQAFIEELVGSVPYPVGEGIAGQVAATGQPVLLPEVPPQRLEEMKPEFRGYEERYGIRSLVIVPMLVGETVVGTLVAVRNTTGHPYTRDDLELLQALAEQAGVVIDNARLIDALQESERRYRMFAENAQDLVFRYRLLPEAGFEYVSPSAERITGYTPEDHYADPELGVKIVHPDDADRLRELMLAGPEAAPQPLLLRWIRRDGSMLWAEQYLTAVRNDEGELVAIDGIARDVTARVEAEQRLGESEELFRTAFEDSPHGMALLSISAPWVGQILRANQAFRNLFGETEEELTTVSLDAFVRPGEAPLAPVFGELLDPAVHERRVERWLRTADGRDIYCLVSVATVRDDAGRVCSTVAHIEDITEQKMNEAELSHRAVHDLLTGLPNRLLLMDRLERALSQLARSDREVALLYVDLDGFKPINDTYGHAMGDQFLIATARRLTRVVRPPDTVARLGGDEFVVVLDIATEHDAEHVASRIVEELAKPIVIEGHELAVTASVGIAVARSELDDPDRLLRAADAAMYRAKNAGRDRYELSRAS